MSQPLPKAILQALDTHYAEDPLRWSKGAWAKNKRGDSMGENGIYSHTTYSICLEAGVRIFAHKLVPKRKVRQEAIKETVAALLRQIGPSFKDLPTFNDNSNLEEVRTVIKKTVAAL